MSDTTYIDRRKKIGKESNVFFFKRFVVKDDRSTMKVGTDAVMLGIAVDLEHAARVLEVGTGCGIITMVLAQRTEAKIDAIEIDEASVVQARDNVSQSPWKDRIDIIHSSLQEYLKKQPERYDIIVSNPPFFSKSFKSENDRRNISRHDDLLTFHELVECSRQMLNPKGSLWVILPGKECRLFRDIALQSGFYLHFTLEIIPKPGKSAIRQVMQFKHEQAKESPINSLILRDEDNSFSQQYMAYTKECYIDF